jgi:signal transduction histidine kinase/CheY-like chemotaxis protein
LICLITYSIVFFAIFSPIKANSQESQASPNVLIMLAGTPDLPFEKKLLRSFQEKYKLAFPNAKVFFEYLDLKKLKPSNRLSLRNIIADKYENIHIDSVVYNRIESYEMMSTAASFLEQAEHFVMYYSERYDPLKYQNPPYTLAIKNDYKNMILEAYKLLDIEKVFVLVKRNESTKITDVARIQESLSDYSLTASVELIEFTTEQDIVSIVNNNAHKVALVITPFYYTLRDRGKIQREFIPQEVVNRLSAQIEVPIFVHWDTLLNDDVLGGYVISAERIADEFIEAIVAVRTGRIPSLNEQNIYEHSYNQLALEKFNVDPHALPQKTNIYNRSPSPVDLFFTEIVGASVIIAILGVMSILLFTWTRTLKSQRFQLYVSEKRLQSSNELLKVATSATKLGIWEYDIHSQELVWDDWMYKHLHKNKKDFAPSLDKLLVFLEPSEKEQLAVAFSKSISQGLGFEQNLQINIDKQRRKYFTLSAQPILSLDDKPSKLVGTLQDITEQVTRAEKLEKEKRKAQQADKAKSQFIASMSHEIRTPMNAIVVSAELLELNDLEQQQREHTTLIKSSAKSMLLTVNDILDLARVENGKMSVDKYIVNLHELIQQTMASFQHDIKEKRLKYKLVQGKNLPKYIFSDAIRIKQVLFNLIGNAIKFTSQGGIELHAHFTPERTENERTFYNSGILEFQVKDTGIGIPETSHKKVFEKFQQADNSIHQTYGGTGLGLHISREIAHLLRGSISLKSEEGLGSQFTFAIPVSIDESASDQDSVTIEDLSTLTFAGKTILIVDDIEINRFILSQLLSDSDASVVFAENGVQAIDIYKSQKVDIILMDVVMPEMDGLDATRKIRNEASEFNPNTIPIIALTAQAVHGDRDICLEAGMNEYLSKPINRTSLFLMLQKLIK